MKLAISDQSWHWSQAHAVLLSPLLWGAAALYVGAFALYVYLLSVFDLTVVSPLMIGGVTLLVFMAGFALGESVTLGRLAGAALVVAGIALIGQSAA